MGSNFVIYIYTWGDRVQWESSVNMMEEEEVVPLENSRRTAAKNAYLNLSKKSSSKLKRVSKVET